MEEGIIILVEKMEEDLCKMDVDIVDKKKYSFYQCLHYYYDYSIDGSTGGPLRFFDNNKIDLGNKK